MSVKPIFFALDGKSLKEFEKQLDILKDHIYGVKVGLELFTSEGPSCVEQLKSDGWVVFLDLKLHDIPNTIGEAAASVSNIGVDYLTLHISSGKEALSEAVDKKSKDLNLLGVSSALTSKSVDSNTSKIVKDEFQIAKDSNLEGVICPASEIANTTNLFDLIVTPGIRLENDLHGDQKNITTPKKAIELGAKYIVMGRSIKNNPSMVINELEV
tara:strand:+ start:156 stop:794 length:639 start_codon:yes stop_codon:yes gene_type:complete